MSILEKIDNIKINILELAEMIKKTQDYEPNVAYNYFIENLFVKRNKNILRLKIIELTASGKSAKEIAKILKKGKVYIEQEKSRIRDLIVDNRDIFRIKGEKPTEVLSNFYKEYKINFLSIYEHLKIKRINTMNFSDEFYNACLSKRRSVHLYKS